MFGQLLRFRILSRFKKKSLKPQICMKNDETILRNFASRAIAQTL